MDRVIIFDTTLRDGEQSPGFSMNTMEKLEMARQLARLQVDVIEAGFPISSDEDFEFSPEDASRSDFDYMCDVLSAVIEAGATTINIPDTVGYAIPKEWGERIARIRERVQGIDKVV